MKEVLEVLLHIFGWFIIYMIVDYDRKEKLIQLNKKSMWIIVFLIVIAVQLIKTDL